MRSFSTLILRVVVPFGKFGSNTMVDPTNTKCLSAQNRQVAIVDVDLSGYDMPISELTTFH